MAGRATLVTVLLAIVLALAEGQKQEVKSTVLIPRALPSLCKKCCPVGEFCPAGCPLCVSAGQCPVDDLGPRILCAAPVVDKCEDDFDCKLPGQKCCQYGCGKQCVSACFPGCRSGQTCRLSSCSGLSCPSSQRASCQPPIQTGRICPKDTEGPCKGPLSFQCYSDKDCSRRGEKCCVRGCNRQCLPSCPRCARNEVCTYETFAACLAIGCPRPPPPRSVCKPRIRPVPVRTGTCPSGFARTVLPLKKCRFDGDCPKSQRCCFSKRGGQCSPVCRNCPRPKKCVLQQLPCFRAPCLPVADCVDELPLAVKA